MAFWNSELGIWQIIHNPASGTGDSDRDLDTICEVFRDHEAEFRVTLTQKGASPVARIEPGVEGVVASGGDGTVMAVAGVLAGTGIPLGIVPRGTANAFALAMGVPLLLTDACELIFSGHLRDVDLARCGSRTMALLAAIGYEAELVKTTEREMKDRFGPLAYLFSGISQLGKQEAFQVRLEAEDRVLELEAVAVTVANAAPPTSILAQGLGGPKPDDGLLDVTVVSAGDRLETLGALAKLVRARLAECEVDAENVRSVRVPFLRLTADPPQIVAVDGEIAGQTPVEFECLPAALKLFTP